MTWEAMCMVLGGFACLVAGDYTYTSPTVHMIYAVPSDRVYDPRYAASMGEAIADLQAWYLDQVGDTFDIAHTSPQVCDLPSESAHYAGGDGYDRVIDDLQSCAPVTHLAQWDTWVIYPDVEVPCGSNVFELGRGAGGITILHHGDLHGISISESDTYAPCDWPERDRGGWIGGLGHELGHAFGLFHPEGCESARNADCDDESKKSLISLGMYRYPDTYLLEVDKAWLREFFRNPIVRCAEYGYEDWCKRNWGG